MTDEKNPAVTERPLDGLVSCDVCYQHDYPENMRHFPVSVCGSSKGVLLCSTCQQAVTDYVRALRSVAGRAKKEGWILGRAANAAVEARRHGD